MGDKHSIYGGIKANKEKSEMIFDIANMLLKKELIRECQKLYDLNYMMSGSKGKNLKFYYENYLKVKTLSLSIELNICAIIFNEKDLLTPIS